MIRLSYINIEQSFGQELDRVRLAARLARSNLEASADRLLAEPKTTTHLIGIVNGILANSHHY